MVAFSNHLGGKLFVGNTDTHFEEKIATISLIITYLPILKTCLFFYLNKINLLFLNPRSAYNT